MVTPVVILVVILKAVFVSFVWMNKDRMPFWIRIEGTFLVPETNVSIYGTCAGQTLTMYLSLI